jgi:hypothetical protein
LSESKKFIVRITEKKRTRRSIIYIRTEGLGKFTVSGTAETNIFGFMDNKFSCDIQQGIYIPHFQT